LLLFRIENNITPIFIYLLAFWTDVSVHVTAHTIISSKHQGTKNINMTPQTLFLGTGLVLGAMAVAVQGFSPSLVGLKRPPTLMVNRQSDFRSRQRIQQSTYPFGADASFLNGNTTDATKLSSNSLHWEEIQPKHFSLEEDALQQERDFHQTSHIAKTEAKKKEEVKTNGKASATMTSATMNLVKVILGTGVLALPAGLAAASDYPIA
jgi:hypothetical protein